MVNNLIISLLSSSVLRLSLCQRCYPLWLNGETFEVVVCELAALFSFVSFCLALSLSLSPSHCRRLWFMFCLWGPPLISCNTAFISVPGPAIASIFSFWLSYFMFFLSPSFPTSLSRFSIACSCFISPPPLPSHLYPLVLLCWRAYVTISSIVFSSHYHFLRKKVFLCSLILIPSDIIFHQSGFCYTHVGPSVMLGILMVTVSLSVTFIVLVYYLVYLHSCVYFQL